jgi:hypothetical protein
MLLKQKGTIFIFLQKISPAPHKGTGFWRIVRFSAVAIATAKRAGAGPFPEKRSSLLSSYAPKQKNIIRNLFYTNY